MQFSELHKRIFDRCSAPNTHTRLTALCPGLPGWGKGKGKTNLDFTGARDSEWQWHQLGMCKSAPCSREITMSAPHHSVFYRPDALPAAQPTASKHWRHAVCLSAPIIIAGRIIKPPSNLVNGKESTTWSMVWGLHMSRILPQKSFGFCATFITCRKLVAASCIIYTGSITAHF